MTTSLLAEIRNLAPHSRPRSAEIEASRRVPRDLRDRLRSAGLFCTFVPTPLREAETFQYELGRIEADVRATRAMQEAATAEHWRHAQDGTMDAVSIARAAQAAVWVTTTYVRAADTCFALGGGSAIYDSSSRQRWMRGPHVAAQHAAVQQQRYANAGKELLVGRRAA